MPELPEVETVRRTLQTLVIGKKIASVEVRWGKIIKLPDDVEQFCTLLQGETIQDVQRRGKFLKIITDNFTLVSHLRMEGRYSIHAHGDEINKHTHIIFHFTDSTELRYSDVRKFGTMHLFSKGEEEKELPLSKLGPEPFVITKEELKTKLSSTRKIKAVLLDQTVVVGLGNIYVDEVLFRAKLHPERLANTVNDAEVYLLFEQIVIVLTEAIEKGGSTIRSYVNSAGESGSFQVELFVYGRAGEECKECGTVILKSKVAGRGTHFCGVCQV